MEVIVSVEIICDLPFRGSPEGWELVAQRRRLESRAGGSLCSQVRRHHQRLTNDFCTRHLNTRNVSLQLPMGVLDAKNRVRKVVVVGAGPVGCLAAMSLAKMGWKVDVYEQRPGKPRSAVPFPWASNKPSFSRFTAAFFQGSYTTALHQPRGVFSWNSGVESRRPCYQPTILAGCYSNAWSDDSRCKWKAAKSIV